MINQSWIRNNKVLFSIIIYIILFTIINLLKPAFMYNIDGSIKDFGVGFRKKTIIPIWLISIFFAIISYFCVLYYTSNINIGHY